MNLIKRAWQGIDANPKVVREFGLMLTVFLLLILPSVGNVVAVIFHHKPFHYAVGSPIASAVVFVVNKAWPPLMTLIYRIAMMVALAIGSVVMRIVLSLLFYLVFSPIRITMAMLRKDLIDQKLDREAKTYWKKRSAKRPRADYERLF